MPTITDISAHVTDPLFDEDSAAAYCGDVAVRTFQRWRSENKGPAWLNIGGRLVRYRKSALDAFLAAGEHGVEDARTVADPPEPSKTARGRAAKWRDAAARARAALEELSRIQSEYEAWSENLPENLQNSPTAVVVKA
jgi:hypothetical protein